jgi:hypothetical protein
MVCKWIKIKIPGNMQLLYIHPILGGYTEALFSQNEVVAGAKETRRTSEGTPKRHKG